MKSYEILLKSCQAFYKNPNKIHLRTSEDVFLITTKNFRKILVKTLHRRIIKILHRIFEDISSRKKER